MIHVKLGNAAPHETLSEEMAGLFSQLTDEQLEAQGFKKFGPYIIKPRPDLGEAVTDIMHPYNEPLELITNIKKFWPQHSTENPAWVSSSDDLVAAMIAREYPGCEIREWN